MSTPLPLAGEFSAPEREEWRALVSAVLAKSGVVADEDPEAALAHITYDGIRIRPLYTAADAPALTGYPGQPPFTRGAMPAGQAWDVRTRHAGSDPAAVNRAVLADLESGATSVWLVVGDGALDPGDLDAALAGVYLDLAPIVLSTATDPARAALGLLTLAEQRGVDPAQLRGSLGADPIGSAAAVGTPVDLDTLRVLAAHATRHPDLALATIDATVYHDAGASDAQELGIATAVGVAYLRALTDPALLAGALTVDQALAALEFRFAVTVDQFASIAKLRAARRIWDRVAELSAASEDRRGQRQHAVTSAAMLTQRDPWVNLLRTTIGCFAAAVGGADAITVAPFDAALGISDDFARRIARNTHAILSDESSLGRVADAGGGSWYLESLTDELARRAWQVFTEVEQAGGAAAALGTGMLGDLLAATGAARADDIAHRRAPITGVSEFAFVDEPPVERPPLPHVEQAGLPRERYAAPFETFRDRADAAPERPVVFLAAIGPTAVHTARLGFATNLFAAGGLATVVGTTSDAASGIDELVAAFRASGTTVACLCSADKLYDHAAAPVAAALRAAGATQIWLAGKVEVDGVDGRLFAGCDVLTVLDSVFAALEVK